MRHITRIALLVALWLLAWGDITLGNLISGVVVATAVLAAFPTGHRTAAEMRVRPLGAVRLGGYVVAQLVLSNVTMAREIVRRTPRAQPGVLAHRLGRPSEEVVTLMTSIIALSPGTMTVDVALDSSVIYVHFFLLEDPVAARTALARLERLTVGALGEGPQRSFITSRSRETH
jgi:multicomponent Na+:H+ antiporter subunit E